MRTPETPLPDWFTCAIQKKELKTFMVRDNFHGAWHVGLWFLMLIGTGYAGIVLWGTPWAILAFLAYGILYSGCDARWHETSHGTVFKTPWLNDLVYFIAAAMDQRDIVFTRWSHFRHHSYTIYTEADLEIAVKKPPNLWAVLLDFFHIATGMVSIKNLILHALGILSNSAKEVVPDEDYVGMFWWARLTLALYLVTIAISILLQSWIPVLLWGLPRFYGAFVQWYMSLLQHAGLEQNVPDHRLSTRTIYMNPIFGFLYMNMEYHLEHHIYPLVPFYALPSLHQRIKDQLPAPYPNTLAAYRELIPELLIERKNPAHSIRRPLPDRAPGQGHAE